MNLLNEISFEAISAINTLLLVANYSSLGCNLGTTLLMCVAAKTVALAIQSLAKNYFNSSKPLTAFINSRAIYTLAFSLLTITALQLNYFPEPLVTLSTLTAISLKISALVLALNFTQDKILMIS